MGDELFICLLGVLGQPLPTPYAFTLYTFWFFSLNFSIMGLTVQFVYRYFIICRLPLISKISFIFIHFQKQHPHRWQSSPLLHHLGHFFQRSVHLLSPLLHCFLSSLTGKAANSVGNFGRKQSAHHLECRFLFEFGGFDEFWKNLHKKEH